MLALATAAVLTIVAGCADASESGDAVDVPPAAGASAAADGGQGAGASEPASAAHPSTSGSGTAWDVSDMPDPCRTLTKEDVGEVLAVPVGRVEHLDSWPPVCGFALLGGADNWFYISDNSTEMARADFERGRANPSAVEPVPGVGDDAYWLPEKVELQVLSGTTHVVARFGGDSAPPDAKSKATTLALRALPRAKPG